MTKLRKVTVLLMAFVLILGLAACGAGGTNTSGGANAGGEKSSGTDAKGADAPKADASGKVTLVTWTNPSTVNYLKGLGDRLKAANGITLEIVDIDSGNHLATQQTRLMANDIDIATFNGGFLQPQEDWNKDMMDMPDWQKYIEQGLFYDLTDQSFIANFDKATLLDAYGYKGKIYGLMGGSIPLNGVYYNIDRFEELGLKVPETWDDFIALCEAIRAAGYQPITVGGGDQWPLNMFAGLITTNVLLDDGPGVAKELFLGTKKFTDPDILELYKMRDQFASFMEPGVVGVPYSDCYGRFATEKALMLADGSWATNDVKAANPAFKFSYFPLPGKVKRADGLPQQMGVKYDFAMCVASKAPNLDGALKVLEFFSDPKEYVNFTNEVGFYPCQPNTQYDNEFLKSMEPYMQKPRQNTPTYTPKGVGEYGANGGCDMFLLKTLGGQFTYEELAAEAQKDWDAARAANAKAQ